MTNTTTEEPAVTVPDLRVVALDRIRVLDGFNPRQARDPERFAATAASVAATGVLQPILVAPDGVDEQTGEEQYRVIAGEGRYLAAKQAGLTEAPVVVREVDEATGGLEWAMEENTARDQMDPVSIAHGYGRLRAARWSVKQIAARFGVTQKLVTERLRILALPEDLHPKVADGTVPLSAIRPLSDLAKAHPDLPAVLVARVGAERERPWEPIIEWADVVENPVAVLAWPIDGDGCALPDDVYLAGAAYPLARFDLTEQATAQLDEFAAFMEEPADSYTPRIDDQALDQARALGCVYESDRHALVIGRDVASQVVSDGLDRQITEEREKHERHRRWQAKLHGDTPGDPSLSAEEREAKEKEERARQREQDAEDRRAAIVHNEELGAEIVRLLAKVNVDDPRVVRLLAAAAPLTRLREIASRGARYGFPGWVTTETTPGGKTKHHVLDPAEAEARGRDYLAAATGPAEITGRLVSLLAMAHYADERAVANSRRVYYALSCTPLPWEQTTVVDLLDDLCQGVLPDHLTAAQRTSRREEIEAEAAEAREDAAARDRLAAALDRAADLTDEERDAAMEDAKRVHGYYSPDYITTRNALAAPQDTDPDPDEEDDSDG